MKKFLIFLLIVVGAGAAFYKPITNRLKERNKPKYKTEKVVRRTVTLVVNSTGDVQPVLSVTVGSFVSGPIDDLYVDFNDVVKKGDPLAKIDPRIYEAAVARDEASVATQEAQVQQVEQQLQQAINDERRSVALYDEGEDYISQTEIDRFHFARTALEAQLEVAKASAAAARANLNNSKANLDYTLIEAPVDGIVIDRKINPGNTLAAAFQTPELFIIAPDMEEKMLIYAAVDEADIGLIRRAQEEGQPVQFTVDAYPDDLFEGEIEQIRFSATELQNVVTYPVVVSAPNPELKLLPNMTADISFTIDKKEDVLCVPNSALRFYPLDKNQVREADRPLLEGKQEETEVDQEAAENASAKQKVDAVRKRSKRHVWVESPDGLKAIEVEIGISDNRYSEITADELEEGQALVVGLDNDS